jgi:hypothetical protein
MDPQKRLKGPGLFERAAAGSQPDRSIVKQCRKVNNRVVDHGKISPLLRYEHAGIGHAREITADSPYRKRGPFSIGRNRVFLVTLR